MTLELSYRVSFAIEWRASSGDRGEGEMTGDGGGDGGEVKGR